MMDFESLISQTQELNSKFPNRYDKRSHLIDLMEEVGELAQAIHIVEGYKHTNNINKAKTVDDIADAVCDCMYELILLASEYKLDLPQEYQDMLYRLKKRLNQGEFNREENNDEKTK